MTAPAKLKKIKKLPKPKKPPGTTSDVWVYQWKWELDPNEKAAGINKYKRAIIKYCREKLSKFNERKHTAYVLHPKWDRIKRGSPKILSVKLIIKPAPRPGSGGLTPPTPPQPPPPSL
jgi:hypothetical protein